ncbi:hypothetical protein RR46_13495 [Papilio xuthus]|nr:hypothetical protein RR46_13495 [Papilio xuthus]
MLQPELKPMPVKLYNAIIDDFNKINTFNRKAENELRKKYKE